MTESAHAPAGFAAVPGSVRLTVADPQRVPSEIAVCPECGGGLWWQFTTTDWLRDLHLDCETEDEDEEAAGALGLASDNQHRNWQSDWQPVIDKVRRWVGSGMSAQNAPDQRLAP